MMRHDKVENNYQILLDDDYDYEYAKITLSPLHYVILTGR